MYFKKQSFLSKVLEGVLTFVACAWLIRLGLRLLEGVWGWLILIAALFLIIRTGWKLYKYYKDTHSF